MHTEARQFVANLVAGKKFGRVVEFGSRYINGGVKDLFDCDEYHGIDLAPGRDVDEVADAATWVGAPADCIVCCEVLEHAFAITDIIKNAAVHLNHGGLLIVTCASHGRTPHSAIDGGHVREGEWYMNVDPMQLKDVCGYVGLTVHELHHFPERGDLYLTATK